jgi:hypothetical protein
MLPKTQILSVIVVLDNRDKGDFQVINDVSHKLSTLGISYEIVLIVNRNYNRADSEVLSALSRKIENLQLFFMRNTTDYKTAVMAGLENSIGDWVLSLDVYQDSIDHIDIMLETALSNNTEIVTGASNSAANNGLISRLMSFGFNSIFSMIHGYRLSQESTSLKLLSRSVVNYILQSEHSLIALETVAAGSNSKKSVIRQDTRKNNPIPLKERVNNRWKILIGLNSAPLRIANFISGAGALLALSYSLYVIFINLINNNVVAGWTTVSLILSSMFMTISIVLWLISEYLVMLSDPNSRKPRYEIAERFASNIQARNNLLNVEVEN